MVLQSFWGSLGLLLGALGGLLGALEASRSTKKGLQIHLGTLVGLVCSPLAAEDHLERILGPSMSFSYLLSEPLGDEFELPS